MHKNIGYHTRAYANNTVKVVGGSFGGSLDIETANRLVNSQFTVTVKPSGRPVFVDKNGREVSLYISVDPEVTEVGKVALAEYHKAREQANRLEVEKMERVQDVLDSMSADEILAALAPKRRVDIAAATEYVINIAAKVTDLDLSCSIVQHVIGQTDGGPAGVYFSVIEPEDWPTLTVEERAEHLREYLKHEKDMSEMGE